MKICNKRLVMSAVSVMVFACLRQTDAQCSSSKVLLCIVDLLTAYGSRFAELKLGFNSTELDGLCSAITSAEQCLETVECSDDVIEENAGLYGGLWLAAKKATNYLCVSFKEEYLLVEKCYESDQVSQLFQQCFQVTREQQNKEDPSQACRIARSYVNCLVTVSTRSCGVNATLFMTQFFYLLPSASVPSLEPANCTYGVDTVQGPCNASAIQFCANSFSLYFDAVSATDVVTFHSSADFTSTCKYVDWMTGCLTTFGCNDSDARVQNRWTRYRDPLVHLCNDQRIVANQTFSSADTTCDRNTCYTGIFGTNSSVRSNCPDGFTLYTSQPTCPALSTISLSTTLETSKLIQVIAALWAWVLVATITGNN